MLFIPKRIRKMQRSVFNPVHNVLDYFSAKIYLTLALCPPSKPIYYFVLQLLAHYFVALKYARNPKVTSISMSLIHLSLTTQRPTQ